MVVSDWCALCQILYDGVDKEDWESMYNALRVAAKKVGIRRSGELALPWELESDASTKHERARSRVGRKSGRTCEKHAWLLWRMLSGYAETT